MGAESWENGDDPVYREIGQWIVIADAEGVEVVGPNTGDTDAGWHIDMPFPSQKIAISLLTGLPENFNPNDFGCEAR